MFFDSTEPIDLAAEVKPNVAESLLPDPYSLPELSLAGPACISEFPPEPLFMDEIEIHKPFPNRQALNLRLQAWYHLMNYPPKIPLAPMPNGIHHPMPPVGMQIGYPVLQHPQMHVQGHHTHIAAATAMSSCHVVVNGVPAPPHLQPFIEDELNQ